MAFEGIPAAQPAPGEITRLLAEWTAGRAEPAAELWPVIYRELRQIASAYMRKERLDHTLQSTALVNEAWLKLAHSPRFGSTSVLHFKRIAARAMRQLLIEAARRRTADKRGGGVVAITLDECAGELAAGDRELLALDEALEELARLNTRQAMMVEARFFGGLDMEIGRAHV